MDSTPDSMVECLGIGAVIGRAWLVPMPRGWAGSCPVQNPPPRIPENAELSNTKFLPVENFRCVGNMDNRQVLHEQEEGGRTG